MANQKKNSTNCFNTQAKLIVDPTITYFYIRWAIVVEQNLFFVTWPRDILDLVGTMFQHFLAMWKRISYIIEQYTAQTF